MVDLPAPMKPVRTRRRRWAGMGWGPGSLMGLLSVGVSVWAWG